MKLIYGLVGAQGRMGVAIREVLSEVADAKLGLGVVRSIDTADADICEQLCRWSTSADLAVNPIAVLSDIDVLIDFSVPENLSSTVEAAVKARVPLLVGVTGLSEDDLELVRGASEFVPVAHVANTSLGIAVLSSLSERAARMLPPSYDVEVLEIHHKHKKDAPSGTALHLVHKVMAGNPKRSLVGSGDTSSAVRVGKRQEGEIGTAVIRGGDVVGEHTVYFLGDGERIELTHRCNDRKVFARGAVHMAKNLQKKEPGFYSAADLIL